MSSAPVFPYPGGVAGEEPPDPTAGAPGHFAWSRWIKQFVKNLDAGKVAKTGDRMTGALVFKIGTTPGVALNADTDFGPGGPTLQVMNEGVNAYAQIAVAATPVNNQHAASKQYVDNLAGTRYATPVMSDAAGLATVSFPAGRFSTAPIIVATALEPLAQVIVTLTDATATGCSLKVTRADNGGPVAVLVYVIAMSSGPVA